VLRRVIFRNRRYLAGCLPYFEVITAGQRHIFDSFECAIHKLAPICALCGCKVIGHGIAANNTFYCCAHCAREAGVTGVADRA
jgi:hypothetical protein